MTTHSKYGMYHPFALDGKTENRGYIAAYYNKAYQPPLAEDVIDEAAIREYSNFLARAYADIRVGRCAGGAHARPHS